MKRAKPSGQLQIEYRDPAKLVPNPKNVKKHSPEQVKKLMALLEEFGWTKPIVIDEHAQILAGHGVWMAARQSDQKQVPVVVRAGLSQAQRRAYVIADNKIAEGSEWDQALLATELRGLRDIGFDLSLTAFDMDEITLMLEPSPSPDTEPPTPALTGHPVSRVGDLWILGEHRLLCGDAVKAESLKRLMNGAKAQCVFSDAPYGVSYESKSGRFEPIKGDNLRRGQLAHMLREAFANAYPHTAEDAGWYVWHASSTRDDYGAALRDVGLVELATLIWVKPGMAIGWADYHWAHEPCFYAARQGVRPAFYGDRTESTVWRARAITQDGGQAHSIAGTGLVLAAGKKDELFVAAHAPKGRKIRHLHLEDGKPFLLQAASSSDNVWEVSRDHGQARPALHPTQKPVELTRRALENSTQEGEAVLDFFGGSGSTLIGAEQTGRRAYLLELDPRYVDVILRRWETQTKKAAHGEDGKTFEATAKARAKAAPRKT